LNLQEGIHHSSHNHARITPTIHFKLRKMGIDDQTQHARYNELHAAASPTAPQPRPAVRQPQRAVVCVRSVTTQFLRFQKNKILKNWRGG
jgi:hypothetical protein